MNKPNPAVLFGFFVAIIVVICGASLSKGGFYLGKHEGDTFHLLQIVFRMADGQWPHLDFVTPIGSLAFAPIALFVKLGYGVGNSIFLSQTLVSLVFLPVVWWVAKTRMTGFTPYFFGLVIFVLIGALVHGEAQRSVSISMHYNRWAWAAAFVAITAAILPPRGGERPIPDGIIIGGMICALALIKITYFAAFVVPVTIALLLYRARATLLVALVTGIAIAAVLTLFSGVTFWLAYLRDVFTVAASEVRPNPGDAFSAVVGAPAYIGGSMALIAAVILLRQSKQYTPGLIMLLLMPGFFYVTYQNFGNDPQWLLLLTVLLMCFPAAEGLRNGLGWDMRTAIRMTTVAALAFAAPSFFNLAYSPFRHLRVDTEDYRPMLPEATVHADILSTNLRTARTDARVALPGEAEFFAEFAEDADREDATVYMGETLPRCELSLGLTAWFHTVAKDLEQAGFADGKHLFTADLFSSYWLFNSLEPLPHGAPWYYGGLPGIEAADYLMVPLCPITPDLRAQILEAVEETTLEFEEVRRTPLYILFERVRSGS